MALSQEVRARLEPDAAQIIARYPQSRSALLPLLHLVQSEEGYVTQDGIEFCAEQLGLTKAEVAAVATFYTMYKRQPAGEYLVSVCTNTLCAVLGGDAIFADLQEHLGVGHDETTERRQGHPGARRVPRGLRLRAGGHGQLRVLRQPDAPVGPRRWSTACAPARTSRRPAARARLCTWKQTSRILAGFPDGQADRRATPRGEPSLAGLRLAKGAGLDARRDPTRSADREARERPPGLTSGAAVTAVLTPVLTARWDEPDAWTLDGYLRARRLPGAAHGAGHAHPTSSSS